MNTREWLQLSARPGIRKQEDAYVLNEALGRVRFPKVGVAGLKSVPLGGVPLYFDILSDSL